MKHTPGPWEVDYIDDNGQIVIRGKDYEIATCWHHCVGSIEKEMYANANLIATAPELLEDLESRYVQTRCGCDHPACNRCEDDRETERVLRKAKGGEE